MRFNPGVSCSTNFVLEKRVDTMEEFIKLLDKPSLFWRYKPFPVAVLVNQSFAVLQRSINSGLIWTIKRK